MKERSYKGKRRYSWKRFLMLLILLGAAGFTALLGVVLWGAHDYVEGEPDVMVILGCQVRPSGPSVMLQDRLDTAVSYLQEHPQIPVIVSGGQGSNEPTTEAQAMAEELIACGIREDRIYLEDKSHNTAENLAFSYQLWQEKQPKEGNCVLVVSNGFHLTRARMLARRAGFDPVYTLAAPSSHVPTRLKMYIREPLALVKSFLLDHIAPEGDVR